MSHCGLDVDRPPEIPFGVRAIQSGIEVEGIWISRPNTPEHSRVDSSTAMSGECTKSMGGTETLTGLDSTNATELRPISDNRRSHQQLIDTSSSSVAAPPRWPSDMRREALERLDSRDSSSTSFVVHAHVPTGIPKAHRQSDTSAASTSMDPFTRQNTTLGSRQSTIPPTSNLDSSFLAAASSSFTKANEDDNTRGAARRYELHQVHRGLNSTETPNNSVYNKADKNRAPLSDQTNMTQPHFTRPKLRKSAAFPEDRRLVSKCIPGDSSI